MERRGLRENRCASAVTCYSIRVKRGLLVLSIVLLRCSPLPELPPCKFSPAPIGELGFVGRPTTANLRITAICPEGRLAPRVKAFSTTVSDPGNRSVAHGATIDASATGVVVSFTPDRPGSWYLTATLDDLGTVQGTLIAVGRGGDGGAVTIDWPQHPTCAGLELTTNGTVLCFAERDGGGIGVDHPPRRSARRVARV